MIWTRRSGSTNWLPWRPAKALMMWRNALIHAVRDDLAEMPEYAHCETAAYAPEPVKSFRRVRRYRYEMMGIVYPKYAEENVLIDYGIIEEEEV